MTIFESLMSLVKISSLRCCDCVKTSVVEGVRGTWTGSEEKRWVGAAPSRMARPRLVLLRHEVCRAARARGGRRTQPPRS